MTDATLEVEVDSVDCNTWREVLSQFEDASIYQTWSYATTRKRNTSVSHILVKSGNAIIAACQIRLRRLPAFNLKVADVWWGPLCMRHGQSPVPGALPIIIRAIKEEYAIKRGCCLRISSNATGERKGQLSRVLETEGFKMNLTERPYRTLMLDLAPPLEELRSNLLQRWRRHLNKAEKGGLDVIEGTSDELFQVFLKLAAEMCERKDLDSLAGYEQYRHIQQDLPESLKMKIFVCQHMGEPVAVTIGSVVGNTGVYLLGATGQAGLGLDASYLVHWRMIQWLKSVGARYYDLGAINPQRNPGGYFFKQGIAGKSGWDETFLRVHQAGHTWRGWVTALFLKGAKLVRR